jgi:hypothetical protein
MNNINNNKSKFKEALNKQLIASYAVMMLAELMIALVYMLAWNYLLTEIFTNVFKINYIQAYIIYYIVKLLNVKHEFKLKPAEEVFESFKIKTLKFINYISWLAIIKIILYIKTILF